MNSTAYEQKREDSSVDYTAKPLLERMDLLRIGVSGTQSTQLEDVALLNNPTAGKTPISDDQNPTESSHDSEEHAHPHSYETNATTEAGHSHSGGTCCPHGTMTTDSNHSSATSTIHSSHEQNDHHVSDMEISSAKTGDMENYKGAIDACNKTRYDLGLDRRELIYRTESPSGPITYILAAFEIGKMYMDLRFDSRAAVLTGTSKGEENHTHGNGGLEATIIKIDLSQTTPTRNQDWGIGSTTIDTAEC